MIIRDSQISAAYLRGLVDYLTIKRQNTSLFLQQFQISEAVIGEPQQRLPTRLFSAMLEAAGVQLNDDHIGLHVGEQIKPGQYGVLGLSVMNCKTLREAVARHERYERLVCDVGHTTYRLSSDDVILSWDSCSPDLSRHIAEENIASWTTFARWITGAYVSPTLIRFQHSRPSDIREHERLFQCSLEFSCDSIEVHFPSVYLDLPLRQHDPAMLALLDEYADRLLLQLNPEANFSDKVKAALTNLLQAGDISLQKTARTLNLSARALQRRLQEEGCSYQQILDETRRELALRQISDERLDLSEITFFLGFADQSAFQRAFKRWTGRTPGQYRREQELTG
ncbi:AraC-type DNA-binding domain-containing protein [Hahella chejuensis KCTC 2396]|uniref:AraC-type DNA-binding domain-containing protein n=1 Tax=Hahella chejuensis (strain KCTC 2396) TaxID=349521 RepID=Q2SAU6_HAHCH|nr:AraC family transcriptional regulator [Hahella chejuensis]ABC32228.1 AraC-type DNA-binding domain-containing protein [Hahella chejuensis KCTC 2396]